MSFFPSDARTPRPCLVTTTPFAGSAATNVVAAIAAAIPTRAQTVRVSGPSGRPAVARRAAASACNFDTRTVSRGRAQPTSSIIVRTAAPVAEISTQETARTRVSRIPATTQTTCAPLSSLRAPADRERESSVATSRPARRLLVIPSRRRRATLVAAACGSAVAMAAVFNPKNDTLVLEVLLVTSLLGGISSLWSP